MKREVELYFIYTEKSPTKMLVINLGKLSSIQYKTSLHIRSENVHDWQYFINYITKEI